MKVSFKDHYASIDGFISLPGRPTRPRPSAPLVVMAVVVSLIILTVIGIYSRVGKTKKRYGSISEFWQFDYSTVRVATNNFSHAKEIGQGGCGVVYKVIEHNYIFLSMCDIINYASALIRNRFLAYIELIRNRSPCVAVRFKIV